MDETIVVLTTWPETGQLRQAADDWLNQGLVACVNILPPMTSLYQWEGEMQQGTEHQIIIKTSASKAQALQQAIVAIHPYECPEILFLEVHGGFEPYLNWITGQTA